jgi:SAM-dependent methyltransferase
MDPAGVDKVRLMDSADAAPARPAPADTAPANTEAELAAEEHARRASSFGAAAAAYAEHRPDYATAAIAWALEPITGPSPRPVRLLDLGAGTGKLTAQLAGLTIGGSKAEVVAVEPDPHMLAELRRLLPGVTALAGKAESVELPDASIDAVLAGQAAHWFDLDKAMPEIARVLRPGGVFAGLWNADDDRIDWVAGLHDASGRRTVTAHLSTRDPDAEDDGPLARWLRGPGQQYFGSRDETLFEHSQVRTADSLVQTLRTHSLFLLMAPAEREAVLAQMHGYLTTTPQTASGDFSWPLVTLALRTVRRG